MSIRKFLILVAVGLLLPAAPARAQKARGLELSFLGGLRVGGAFTTAINPDNPTERNPGIQNGFSGRVIADIAIREQIQLELTFSRQITDFVIDDEQGVRRAIPMDVDYYHMGVLFQTGLNYDRMRGFGTVSIGVTNYIPENDENQTRMGFALGGGGKLRLSSVTGFRFQGIFGTTYINSSDQLTCGIVCYTAPRSHWVSQWELSAGFTVYFGS